MRGEELEEAFVGYSGIYGDRLYAIKSSACEMGFPYLTGREQGSMLRSGDGFGEDGFVGRTLGLGSRVQVTIVERDPRCKMITLNPDTTEMNPKVLQIVGRGHGGKAGVYGAVLVKGKVRRGDSIIVHD